MTSEERVSAPPWLVGRGECKKAGQARGLDPWAARPSTRIERGARELRKFIQTKGPARKINPIMPSLLKLSVWLPFILDKHSSFQCPAGPWWVAPAHLPSFTSNQASSVISSSGIDLSVPRATLSPSLCTCCRPPSAPLGLQFLSASGPQLQGHNFKEDFAVHPVQSLALCPYECLGSQRSWSFTSLRFHSWSPRRKRKFLKCRGCICLLPTVPWAWHSVWYRSHAQGAAE